MGAGPQAQEQLFALRQAVALIEGKASHAARMAAEPDHAYLSTPSDRPMEPVAADSENVEFAKLMAEIVRAGVMVEIRSQRMQDAGSASGFVLALARLLKGRNGAPRRSLLIADAFGGREAGMVYAPGLVDFGLEPGELVHAMPRRIEDALWLADAALTSRAFSAVLLEVHGNPKKFGLTESRRLSLRSRDTGGALFLLRQAGEEEASSAPLRLLVEPAPAVARKLSDGSLLGGSIGHPVFRVLVEKSRSPGLSQFILEWNIHERRLYPLSAGSVASPGPAYPGDLLSETGNRSDRTPSMGIVVALDRAS